MNVAIEKELNLNKSSWKPVKFGDVVTEPKESTRDIVGDGFEHIVGLEHIETENIHLKRWMEVGGETTFSKVFRKGDVLFGRRRAYLKKAALANFDGVCSGDITVFRTKPNLLPDLLPFIVNNERFFDYAIKHSAGGLSPRVKFKDLANFEFLLPPKEEQKKLAELLWTMDDVVEKEKMTLEKLEIVKKTNSAKLLSNIITTTKLKDLADIIMGQSPDGKTYNKEGRGMAFLQGNAEFTDFGPANVLFTTAPNKIAKPNDILISVRAPVGELNIAQKEFCIGRGLAAIRLKDPKLINFVFEYIKNSKDELHRLSTGSTFKAINKDILHGLEIKISHENKENEKILNFYNVINKDITTCETKIYSSKSLQKSLINQIF